MAKYSNTVEYNIRTTLDNSGISRLQSELTQLQNHMNVMGARKLIPQETVNKTLADITKVRNALTQAFNPKLGMLNTSAFLKNLEKAGLSMNGLYQSFSKAGATGVATFNSMYGQIAKIDTGMRSVSSTTDKIMNTLGNTVRWGLIASGFAAIMRSVHSAAEYVKDLDKSLTNIQMVTAASRDTMNDFAVQANKVAQRLGGTTVQMTNATEVFIRQGYDLATSSQLGEYAVHLANVSGQDSAVASDEITAYMNAFKIPLEDLGNAVSKWAAVANNAAVSVEELSVASQKAAAVATTVGVDMDQFAAHIAAIEATTREAPENIGNGLKTIYSRIADVKLGETLEDGVDLGSFAKAIEKVGVDVLDTTGNLRDAGDILEDLMVVWQDLDQTQRAAVAKTVAGRFQLARFEALMNSADIYEKSLKTSRAETGTATYDRMQETYRESLEGRSKALQASVEEIFLNLFTTDSFYGAIDALQGLVDTINDLIKATGGGETALIGLVAVMTKLASNTLARGISNFIVNRQADMAAQQNMVNAQQFAKAQLAGQGLNTTNARTNMMAMDVAKINQYSPLMNEAQIRQSNELLQQRIQIENELAIVTEKHTQLEKGLGAAFGILGERATTSSSKIIALWESYQKTGEGIEILDEEFKKLNSDMSVATERIMNLANGVRDGSIGFEDLQAKSKEVSEILEQVAKSGAYEGDELIKLTKIQKALADVSKGVISSNEELSKTLETAGIGAAEFATNLERAGQYAKNAGQELQATKTRLADLSAAAEHAAGKMQQMSYSLQLQNATNQILGLTSAAMSFVFVLQSVENLSKIWDDKNLDFGEKLKASLLDFTMIAVMAVPMIGQIKTAFIGMKDAIALTTAAQIVGSKEAIIGNGLQIASNKELEQSEKILAIAKAANIDATMAEATLNVLEAVSKGAVVNAAVEEAAAEFGVEAAVLKQNVAKVAGTGINYGFAASAKAVTAAILPMAIATLAIASAALGIKALVEWYNKDAIAAERAAESAKHLAEQLDAAEQRSEELNQSIEDYKEAVGALRDLERGTEEWNKQLDETNDKVVELLNKYPELAKYVTKTASGELRISNQGLVELEAQQQAELNQAQAAATMGQVNKNNAQLQADTTHLRRSIDWYEYNPMTEEGNYAYLSEAELQKIITAATEQGEQILNDDNAIAQLLGVEVSDPMVKAVTDSAKLIAQHIDKGQKIQAQNEILNNQAMEDYLKAQGIYSNDSGQANAIVQQLSGIQQQVYDQKLTEYNKQSIEDLTQAYLASDEGKQYHLKSTDSHWAPWDSAQAEAILVDENGNELHFTQEMMAESLASVDSMQAAAEKWDEVANKLLGINDVLASLSKTYKGINQVVLSGETDKDGNTHFDYDTMTTAGLKRFVDDYAGVDWEPFMEELQIDDELAQQRGYENGRAYAEALWNGAKEELEKREALNIKLDDGTYKSDYEFDSTYQTEANDIVGQNYTYTGEEYANQAKEILDAAESVYELNEAFDKGYLGIKEYNQGMIDLATGYADLKKNIDKVSKAQSNYEKVMQKEDRTEEELLDAQLELIDAQEELRDGLETKEWDKARDSLQDYADALANAEEDAVAYNEAAHQIADVLTDLTGIEVSADWVKENQEAVQDWLNGVEGAGAKLDALMHLDLAAAQQEFQDALDAMGLTYEQVRSQIANNEISFDMTGHADFSQVIAALGILQDESNITTEDLQFLAAYLNALGGASLELKNDQGEVYSIAAPDMSGSPEEVTAAMNQWMNDIRSALQAGWHFSGIDLPDSPMSVPTHSTGGGGSDSGGGGGGGGGGSKSKSVEKAEGSKSSVDPYNKVNATLDKLADNYTKVEKAKDRMYGDRYRRAAENEIRNLLQQNTQLEKRVEISEKIAEALRTGQDNPNYGIYLDGESLVKYGLVDNDLDGVIDNYIQIYNEALEKQNAAQKAADDYWASTGGEMDEDQQKRYNELKDAQKDAADYANKITDVTNKYQETMDKIRDDTEQITENTYEIEDHVIDIWNYAKDAAKELNDVRNDQIDLAETLATLWGDDAVKSLGFAFDRFTNMFEANEKTLSDTIIDYRNRLNKATDEDMKKWYQDQIDLAQQAIANGTSVLDLNMQRARDIFKALDEWKATGKSSLFGSNEKAMWEAFDEAWKDAVDYASDLKGYIKDIHDNMQDVMDDMYDVMDERDKMFDQAKDQYEYLKDMTELVYGEKAYGTLETITRKQAQADEEHLKTLEQERQINHEMLESLEEGSEEYKDALEKERDLDSAILDIRKDIADTYREAKELANDLAIQNWLDNFTADVNGVQVPLEYAADAWERIKENADNYLDDLNRAWELEKLENEYLKLIDEAVDPNLQRQITEQMEQQLEYLREKDKLSQYDVNYANAQLEILQKTIALEDARANKNQMKLRRDSQGNYSYVYAADRNDVRDKENDLLDARMNGYNISVEASTDATDRYLQKVQSMADALRDVANDQSLSQEQIEAITQSIIEDGYQFLDAMGEQLTTAQRNGIESYIQAAQELSELNAGNVLDISQQLEEGLIDDLGMVTDVFNAAVLEWVDGETGLSYFRDAANQAGEDIVRNVGDFVAAVGAANANIQTPLNDIQNGLTQTNQAMSDLTSNAKEFYNFLEDKSGVVQRAAQDLAYYQNKLTDMGDEMNAYYTEWNNRGKELESEKAINSQLNIDIDSLKKEKEQLEKQLEEAVKGSNKGGGGSGNKGNYSDSDIAWGIAQNIWTYGSWGNDPYRHSRITERYGEAIADLTQRYINDYWATGQLVNWGSDIWGYATGGYTGSWTDNENGRIALLHQKELVLNEEDTENMLAAISIVRDLVDKIKGSSFKDSMNSFTNNSSDFVGNNIEQRVEIKAEFPGVRSAADIENALINLSNKAYQYAYNQNEKFI